MLKEILKKIPGVKFLYRFAMRYLRKIIHLMYKYKNTPRKFLRSCRDTSKDLFRLLQNYLKRREIQVFKKNIEKWNFDHAFSDLLEFAGYDHDYLETTGNRLIREDKTNPKGYALIQACCEYKPKPGHYDVGLHSLAVGNELVSKGKLAEARTFFLSLQKIFPEIYEPYAILYDLMYTKQEEYRAAPVRARHEKKKPLVLSFSIWGDKYIRFFNDYCIPCMMAEGNLPAVAKIRHISVDIYAHQEDILKFKKQDMFETFSNLCEINLIEFPKRLITCEGYKRNDAAFRYNVYGGFHHLSIERARSIGADVICLGPDNIYSDGSFLNYVKFIDEGFSAVLFTATRAQAEFLVPVLDTMKDSSTKTLSITADQMVEFSAQYIHHSFLQYIVTDNMTPAWRSAFFIPYKNGFTIRSFHYHPVIISASALDRSKDFLWNYTTADCNLITVLFPDEKDWENIKVITDSREGIMLDVAYGSPGIHHQDTVEFSEKYLDKTCSNFDNNQFWNFGFTVNYRMDQEMPGVRAYLYGEDGTLHPREFPLTATIESMQKRIDDWYNHVIQPTKKVLP